jgi:sugar phosphate isomerase/epimerase
MTAQILLGTVAIEPMRWARLGANPSQATTPISLSDWLDSIADAGFDGVEIWENHLLDVSDDEWDRVADHRLPVHIWNSYTSLDDDNHAERQRIAARARRIGAKGIKFNVGNHADRCDAYADRISEWVGSLGPSTSLLCECHAGISIAEDPFVAARIFERAGPIDRVQAIVHTHEDDDHLRRRFDAYGERISHVHVNYLDTSTMTVPELSSVEGRLAHTVALLDELGFCGTWTIEFCAGVLSGDDHPEMTIAQAGRDLALLRGVLRTVAR